MDFFIEGRSSDSPLIDMIWRGRSGENYAPVCPADEHWDILFSKQNGIVKVAVEGPLTKAMSKFQADPAEFLVIRFKLGVYMSYIPVGSLLDGAAILPDASSKSVWIHGGAWQFPDYDNVETFVDWLAHDGVLRTDPVIDAVLKAKPQDVSVRTVRRRFQNATGLTLGTIRQIERARQAAALLERGVPILDAVYEAGYADQPHMTRSLKLYVGQTPAQIARVTTP